VLAVHEELTRPRVMAVVADLGARGASGVLEVKGNPSGAIYLDRGRIAFAWASWVPGLVARLRGILPSPAELQDLLAGRDTDDAAVAALAVKRGYLTPAGLHELIGSIVVDAFLVLTIPLAMDSTVASIRFASARTYWTEMFPRLDIDPVRWEALRRAQRMADYGLAPTTTVALRDLRRPTAVLTREQWAVASLIIGNASAREIALRHGTALADTVECLGSLIRVGLCTPVRVTERPHVRRVAPDHPAMPEGYGLPSQAPTVDILRQVLNGLRKLS
jgi:stage V sporulation protein SpoVS